MLHPVHVGCSGWNYRDWRGPVYPPGLPVSRWLERYAELFDTVEVNNTFYRLARPDSVAKWVEQTPEHFTFVVKASRYLTHMKRLQDMDRGVGRFYDAVAPLVESPKLAAVLWQLPEKFHRDDQRLAHALEHLPPGRHCFELRHQSWFCEPVYELLRLHDVALAIGDHPDRPWIPLELTADWTLIRFHYGQRGRRGNYSDAELVEWAARIATLREHAEVFVYFNNDWEAFAVRNGLRLRKLLGV
jgi:uncharacterized protein YecE (DUF72 family)